MKRKVYELTFMCLLLSFLAGCANISVFSSKHEHYYEGKETRELLRNLEKRVQALLSYISEKGQVFASTTDDEMNTSTGNRYRVCNGDIQQE